MKNGRNVMNLLTTVTDLQEEPLPGIPLMEIAGDQRILVENHMGIMEYGTETIRIRVKYGQVCVQGTGLEICKMCKGQLVIRGRLDSVQLFRGCC